MPNPARDARMRLGWFVIVLVILVLAVDGGVSRTEALDRWVGTAVLTGDGVTFPLDFTVVVDPGGGATWEWRSQGTQIASGPLAASVSGSTVDGVLIVTGGAIYQPFVCCSPCNFSGSIAGNRVEGTFDAVSCGGTVTFVLVKQ